MFVVTPAEVTGQHMQWKLVGRLVIVWSALKHADVKCRSVRTGNMPSSSRNVFHRDRAIWS